MSLDWHKDKRKSHIFVQDPRCAGPWDAWWGPRDDLGSSLLLAETQVKGIHSSALARHLCISWSMCFLWKAGVPQSF